MMSYYMKSWKLTVRKSNLKTEEMILRNLSKKQAIEFAKSNKLYVKNIVEII